MKMSFRNLSLIGVLILLGSFQLFDCLSFEVEDVHVSEDCPTSANPGDHLLLEYYFKFSNGTGTGHRVKAPSQLHHVILEQGVT